jgi:plasmid replication initiation protein
MDPRPREPVPGRAGTGKSHLLVALGAAAVAAGHKVRYHTAAELTETLYRGLADNSVGRVIDTLLRNDLILIDEAGFAPLDDTGAQLLFRVVAAACERRALGIASHWPFESWGRFLPEHTTAVSLLDNPAPRQRRGHLRNAKLQLTAVLVPGDEVPGLYLHPDHRRRLRRVPVRSDLNV